MYQLRERSWTIEREIKDAAMACILARLKQVNKALFHNTFKLAYEPCVMKTGCFKYSTIDTSSVTSKPSLHSNIHNSHLH